eukprot:TRINITY_DN49190_c0_g1_i1.p1 TRINITY_DN49190_c0_g1~~TRINITY_DN49190_c0_g1_i1.p1  ORF type:complete len:314 (+),score=40.50 TRINITY_DN49190_c0_g1_i1:26-967(+)
MAFFLSSCLILSIVDTVSLRPELSLQAPRSIEQLATELFGESRGKDILSKAIHSTTKVNGKSVTLFAYGGDDAVYRLPAEFASNVYGVNSLKDETGEYPLMDVGANLGTFSLAAHAVNPKLKIIALEPMPITYLFLRWNLEANGVPSLTREQFYQKYNKSSSQSGGVLALNAGATADARDIDIMYDPRKSENAVTSASAFEGKIPQHSDVSTGHEIKQTIKSLDVAKYLSELGVKRLAFFKIDCEGCEHEVAPTLSGVLKNSRRVGGEIHPCMQGMSCVYPAEVVSRTRDLFCKIGGCCTPQGATGSATCTSA